MPSTREKLGMLGSGMARKTGETLVKSKRKKKKRLDGIMSQIKAGRKSR